MTTTDPIVVTKDDDIRISTTLTENGSPADVSSADNISAAITSRGRASPISYVQNLDLDSADPDADWANGVVVVVFPRGTTGSLPVGGVRLEIQVTKSGLKNTWYEDGIESRHGVLA